MISSLIFLLARERDLLVSLDSNVSGVVLHYGSSFIPYIMNIIHAEVLEVEDWKNFHYLGINWVYTPSMEMEDIKFKLVYGD